MTEKKNEVKVEEKHVEEKVDKEKEEKKKLKEETLEKIQKILAKHGGLESNIPPSDEYWGLVNTYRGQLREE